MEIEQLKTWAESLRVSPGFEESGLAILHLIDAQAHEEACWSAVESALAVNDVEHDGDDLVATLEGVLVRYAHVRGTFNAREEFDLSGDSYERDLGHVLMTGDKAGTFKWKVIGILRKAGAIPQGAVKMGDDQILMLLGMMMP